MAALLPVVPDAKISSDVTNQLLIVTASAEDQQRVAAIIEEADQGAAGELVTQVYKLQWANPTALSTSLRPIAPRATLSPDVYNKTLIVTATAQDQARIKPIVEQADRKGEGELSTKVYAFKRANPATVATALTSLLPNATLSSDASTNTLIATATAEDHQTIAPLVEQLDVADPKANVLKPYRVENADPQQVYMSLTELFRTNRNVSIGFQAQTGMILVFAPAADQTEVEQAIRDIDLATVGRPRAVLQVYSLEGLDGESAVATLRRVLLNETPKIELQLDETNNQLLAIADPLQHVMIRQALQQLSPEPRDVEVFTLQRVDPYTASSAISTLFSDLPYAAMPSVEADPNTQQLMIRATKSQLERIEQLLQKMGEGGAPLPGSTQGSILRVLPMSGDVENTLQQIQSLWPRVRGNPLEVLMPPPRRGRAPDQPAPPAPAPNEKDAPKADQTDTPPPPPSPPPPADAPPADAPAEPAPPDAPADAPGDAVTHAGGVPVHFVSMQDEPPAQAAPPAQETPVVVPPQAGDAGAVVIAEEQPAAEPAPLAPIVVIASEGRITIASRDVAALDQFENLWKMLQRGRRVRIEAGNYSMFLLQNADAQQLAEVLEQLFRRGMRGGGGESYRPYFRRSAPLTVVADERMNALLVYGSVADRQAVEEILDVLDSMDLPESLTTPRPRMIPVQNLPANNVLTVLQTVYRTQLSARSGVRPITIPQGISFEMSSMLQLINAAAEAPLLTLDVDLTTNSIVMRAPRQLGEEIEEFIQELDEQAKDGGKRSISLVPLKTMNTSEVQDALQMLMRGGGRYRGR